MKLRNLHSDTQPQFMIIPMIDIMFFLLVFFMMSTLYMVDQHTLPVQLPQTALAQRSASPGVTVTIRQDGRIFMDDSELAVADIASKVTALRHDQSDALFIIRADQNTDYKSVISVLDAIKLAGAQRIALASEIKIPQ